MPHRPAPKIETRSLDELHRDAVAEGGKLVLYASGDIPNAYAEFETAFKTRFPRVDVADSVFKRPFSFPNGTPNTAPDACESVLEGG